MAVNLMNHLGSIFDAYLNARMSDLKKKLRWCFLKTLFASACIADYYNSLYQTLCIKTWNFYIPELSSQAQYPVNNSKGIKGGG
ncbi:MAG TPA: hypothetical protein ENH30_04605 [Nitrospirae bacterium]|nr:hypothetical protein [Nitrospirota bacterium]